MGEIVQFKLHHDCESSEEGVAESESFMTESSDDSSFSGHPKTDQSDEDLNKEIKIIDENEPGEIELEDLGLKSNKEGTEKTGTETARTDARDEDDKQLIQDD